jgi:regulator of sirC expression with transglutaminase-like and TPR domain
MPADRPEDFVAAEDLHRFETPDEAFQYVRYTGTLKDEEIDLGEAAIALALLFLPGVRPERYRHHLKKLGDHLEEEYQSRLRLKEKDTLALRLACLIKIVHEAHGYEGDEKTYDDIQNASLIRVIERRKGLPIALGIIYIVLARRMGWQIDGLSFPGHFLVRMEAEGERVIIDPFRKGKEMNAAELRNLLKSIAGKGAELSHNYYAAVSNRDMLIRLQNNLKKRLIEMEEYAQAVIVLEAMEALAPDEYRSLFDKGVLYAKLGQSAQAETALLRYIEKAPSQLEKQQARAVLQQIKANPD